MTVGLKNRTTPVDQRFTEVWRAVLEPEQQKPKTLSELYEIVGTFPFWAKKIGEAGPTPAVHLAIGEDIEIIGRSPSLESKYLAKIQYRDDVGYVDSNLRKWILDT